MQLLLKTLAVAVAIGNQAMAAEYRDRRSRSPHFADGKFHNPVASAKSFWSFLKMRMGTSYAEWPEWVETPYGKINPIRVDGQEMHVSHINHSTVLIQVAGKNILTDPIFSDRCSPVSWAGPHRVRSPGVRLEELPPIDLVLISHDHYDHLDLPTIRRIMDRDQPRFIMGLGVGAHFAATNNIVELDWWESFRVDSNLEVHFVPVQHFSGRTLWDRNATMWGGFVIKAAERRIYFGGDTGYASHFKETRERLGPMDLALLPIGAYAPRDFMSYAHINPEEAVQAHLDLSAATSIGVHYGTFQLTAEDYDAPLRELAKALDKFGIDPSKFLTPEFGSVVKF